MKWTDRDATPRAQNFIGFFFFFFFLQLYIEHLVIWEQKNLDKECGVNSRKGDSFIFVVLFFFSLVSLEMNFELTNRKDEWNK
jgi:hypothetical protein